MIRSDALILLLLLWSSAILAAPAVAQPVPSPSPTPNDPCGSILSIVTRPTVTTSVCTVRPRKALAESGYTNTTMTGAASGETVNYPQLLLRFGAGDRRIEYDLSPPTVQSDGPGTRGASDISFGLKSELGYTTKWSWGINAQATLPTGSSLLTAGAPTYTGNFNWAYSANSTIGFSGTLGFSSLAAYDAKHNLSHFFAFAPSAVITASWPADTEFFAEYAYVTQVGAGLGGRSLIDYGIARDFGAHVQIDIEGGEQPTLVEGARLHYVGAGISFMN